MRAVLTAPSKFHFFELGAQLESRGLLEALVTGYPKGRVSRLGVSPDRIRSRPLCHVPYRVLLKLGLEYEVFDKTTFDWIVSKTLPQADVLMAMAGSALWTGTEAQRRGMGFVLDRPCSHIGVQNRILIEEARREGIAFPGIHPVVVSREQEEYRRADLITVPSSFALRSFLEMGFDEKRLRLIPYGVDLSSFYPSKTPAPDRFDVVFVGLVGLRKGVVHLLRAFERLNHPRKRLLIVGHVQRPLARILAGFRERLEIVVTGHVTHAQVRDYMSSSHAFVLPSVEDGYGVVMSQAMACGTPVVASTNTGAEMLYRDGEEGFIVPVGDDDALLDRLQRLADDPALIDRMSKAALATIRGVGGWDTYGDQVAAMLAEFK